MWNLVPEAKDFDLALTEEEVLADLGFAYARIPVDLEDDPDST